MILQRLTLRAAFACALLAVPTAGHAGKVSFYGTESGNRTANGERFIPGGQTCAHRSWRFGTRVRVTDSATGRSVVCRVNDRGPAAWTGRELDLAKGAAASLGMIQRGVIHAEIHRLD